MGVPLPQNVASLTTTQGRQMPLAADYTTSLGNVADFAYDGGDGLGIQKVFQADQISIRYTTSLVFGAGKTAIARIRGSAESISGPAFLLREAASGVCQTLIMRFNGQQWQPYQFNAAQNYTATSAAAAGMSQADIGTGWWFKAEDDGVNLILSVSYDASPNAEPTTWRTIATQGRRLYNGNPTGLGPAGWTQVGVATYGFILGNSGSTAVLESMRVF